MIRKYCPNFHTNKVLGVANVQLVFTSGRTMPLKLFYALLNWEEFGFMVSLHKAGFKQFIELTNI